VTLRYVFTLIIYFKEIFMLGKRGVTMSESEPLRIGFCEFRP